MGIKVLLVGDDLSVSESIQTALKAADCAISVAQTDEVAFIMASAHRFDVMVLDLSLPLRCGMEVLNALRKLGQDLPILILCAQAEVTLRVEALRQGADDFLTKPFSLVELEIRLHALLRRSRAESLRQFTVHDLTLDVSSRHVKQDNQTVELTRVEFDLLQLLLRREA